MPGRHAAHAKLPRASLAVPAGHGSQTPVSASPNPTAHTQAVAPAGEPVPSEHTAHSAVPTLAAKVSAGHAAQVPAPAPLNRPRGQLVQVARPSRSAYLPATHDVHSAAPATLCRPTGHRAVHDPAATRSLYRPARHAVRRHAQVAVWVGACGCARM